MKEAFAGGYNKAPSLTLGYGALVTLPPPPSPPPSRAYKIALQYCKKLPIGRQNTMGKPQRQRMLP